MTRRDNVSREPSALELPAESHIFDEVNMEQTIKDIKKELRAAMNGILSARMREVGMPYKLAFGVELPRLQEIADEFPHDRMLAQSLWNENIRECKILACMRMPKEDFTAELADVWSEEITTPEMAQVMVAYLLRHTVHAAETAFRWIASGNTYQQLCGFLCLARCLRDGAILDERSAMELRDQAESLLQHASLHLRKSIMAALDALEAKQ